MNKPAAKIESPAASVVWYRDPFRWLVITPPLLAVLAGAVTTWLAIRSYDGLVVDDYYKQGLQINQAIARDTRAQQLGIGVKLEWQPVPTTSGTGTLHVLMDDGANEFAPDVLTVKLIYATHAGLDRDLEVARKAAGDYVVPLSDLRAGRWQVHLSDADWRVVGSFTVTR